MYDTGHVPQWARREPADLSIARRVGKVTRWALRAPADRLTIPAAAVVWGSGAVLHATGVPTLDVGLIGGVALPAVTYGVVLHRGHAHDGVDNDQAAWRAAKASFGMLIAGAWAATAARWGVFAGPDGLSSLIYGAGTGLGYAFIRADELTRQRRNWRDEKTRWLAVARLYGLQGSHLLASETTRLGKRLTIDVTGTGRRASSIASRDTGERIAEHRQLPPSRVQVTTARIAGRVHISIRDRDPWLHAIPHPLFDDAPEIELPASQSILAPLTLGQDPETGKPLELVAYDQEDGAKAIMIISTRGGGKTVLLNDLMERLTACRDVLVWDINLSKAKENRRWAPACDLVAHGPNAKRDALAILRMARKAIEWRGNIDSDDAVHQPTATAPAIVVRVDEMKSLLGGQSPIDQAIRDQFTKLNETGRSEGIVTVVAGQRAVVTHAGSADIRANVDTYLLAKVRSRGEMMHAAGDMGLDLPDMTTYGEGYPGVWLIGTLGGEHAIGRTFLFKHLPEITKLAADRKPAATLEPGLREYLGDAYERLKTGQVTAHPVADEPVIPGWMGDLDKEIRGDMDADLFDEWERIDARNAATGRQLEALASEDLRELGPEYDDALRAATAERTRQAAMTVEIPADRRQAILDRVKEGAAMRDLVAHVGVGKTTMFGYLARLRYEGLVEVRGKGAGSRWHLTDAGDQ